MQRLTAGELHQHAREMRALLLAAGQRRQLAVAEALQSHLFQCLFDQRAQGGAAASAGSHLDDFLDGEGKGDMDML